MTTRNLSDIIRVMRLAISRRNPNDPDSSDATLISYINDAYALTMSDDVKLFEQFGTLTMEIDETNPTGVYQFPGNSTSFTFRNISSEVVISLTNPVNNSVSWNYLQVFQDPGEFFWYWGINNYEVLIPGFPTQMLYYGNEFTFRTIPDQSYTVQIFGYQSNVEFAPTGDPAVAYPEWFRYVAYLAAKNYAVDYTLSPELVAKIDKGWSREKSLLLGHTHTQLKASRAYPRF